MPRSPLLVALALLLAWPLLPAPAAAQSDPLAQSLIDRLRPTSGGPTRGLRVPTEASPAAVAPVAPVPIWTAPAAAPAPRPQVATNTARPAIPVAAPVAAAPAPAAEAPSVSITVTFPSGSATLTPDAARALAPLGRALASAELAPYRFRIEGHTDTVGDPELNRSLSERRAVAVRNHLASAYGVPAARLVPVGLGQSQPVVPTAPGVAEERNRRVQVVNLGS